MRPPANLTGGLFGNPGQRVALFSAPVMRAGKAAIARCADRERFGSLAAIDQGGVKVLVNPGGTNERFDRAALHAAEIVPFADNLAIFDALAAGQGDVMIHRCGRDETASETASCTVCHSSGPAV
jgi:ABC-type amino acid transport substrate-binding protein